jgi:hypothetical protein
MEEIIVAGKNRYNPKIMSHEQLVGMLVLMCHDGNEISYIEMLKR